MATMMVLLFIGVIIDSLFFTNAERAIRKRYGFIDEAAANMSGASDVMATTTNDSWGEATRLSFDEHCRMR